MDTIKEDGIARVLDAAENICMQQGSASADDVAEATGYAPSDVVAALLVLTGRGKLLARPGGLFARALKRTIRLPGQSYVTGLAPLTPIQLMRTR
jgi:hypothetical protein